ncbi:hypothetical protein QVD17_19420 [Tagetes erecta]|uniref:Uncharacterized protein n=1 Tax=Tagetes erecta TaxID=13708 RepID=A0AAD8KPP6_TARER|nr:hypothetical protein QVD17_19420 [Tagetes erecta]
MSFMSPPHSSSANSRIFGSTRESNPFYFGSIYKLFLTSKTLIHLIAASCRSHYSLYFIRSSFMFDFLHRYTISQSNNNIFF